MDPTNGREKPMATPRVASFVLVTCLLVVAHSGPATAAAPSCPAGEITLTSARLRGARTGTATDRIDDRLSTFVLPQGVSIDPAHEPISFVVEGDHQVLYQTDIPAGGLVATRNGTLFQLSAQAAHAIGAGSRLTLRQNGVAYRMSVRLKNVDAPGLASNPHFGKILLKIGDDCFSSVLVCSAHQGNLRCAPERTALLRGHVADGGGNPLPGTMITVSDATRLESISVFAQEDGHYVLPRVRPGTYGLRARLLGWGEIDGTIVLSAQATTHDFALSPLANANDDLPASQFLSLVLPKFPTPTTRGDFTLSCGNCHQIAGPRFREDKSVEEWGQVVTTMQSFLPPYHAETRPLILPLLLDTYGPNAILPKLPIPPPPSGDVLRATIYEYGLQYAPDGSTDFSSCHDLQLGQDNVVYNDSGVQWIDPRTGEHGVYPMNGGGHSIQRDHDGNMWITQADHDTLAKLDVHTGQFTYYPLPKIGDIQGAYPHTLRFDANGIIWMTLTKSNDIARFDPSTAQFTYYPLPTSDPAEVGLSVPVAYGCDVAPDQEIWFSQLFGQRIGRLDPSTGEITAWKPPFYGPRRLRVGADGIVWVPGYGSGALGRFDPTIERWKTYPLPTGIAGPPGYGNSEEPYALNANRQTGDVWITGSASDTLIRFDPSTETFSAYPVPTRGSFMREILFDPDGNPWTCTSDEPAVKEGKGRGKFVKIELPPKTAVCGNGVVEPGEECDDGNTNDCDACSNRCTLVTGCGDGTRCGNEQCDDGNTTPCDGCSPTCTLESGLLCGDGTVNGACGEQCDPPTPGQCDAQCQHIPYCGDGHVDPGEECDDGNSNDCDTCSNHCTLVTGCGDGTVCGAEECDDGNTTSCDGCSSTCTIEPGGRCGDGVIDPACGEQCDPPGPGNPECNYLCQNGPAAALGTRHLSFGGSSFTSALGLTVPLAQLSGAMDLVAGAPGTDGVATVTMSGPIYYDGPILGGAFGTLCFRVTSCTGIVDCDGGTAVDATEVQDSAGPGTQGNAPVITTGLGANGGPGAVQLTCQQSFVQLPAGESDCTTAAYPPDAPAIYTTGTSEGHFLNGDPRIGNGEISVSGENFQCSTWSTEDGPGELANIFLIENDPEAGDTANGNVLDD
jgi:cysteine-rich repeat protein